MVRNPIFHSRTKHIALKHHFIREATDEERLMDFCKSEEQVADISTKAWPKDKCQKMKNALGVQVQHIKMENAKVSML